MTLRDRKTRPRRIGVIDETSERQLATTQFRGIFHAIISRHSTPVVTCSALNRIWQRQGSFGYAMSRRAMLQFEAKIDRNNGRRSLENHSRFIVDRFLRLNGFFRSFFPFLSNTHTHTYTHRYVTIRVSIFHDMLQDFLCASSTFSF